ncbi:hypothetical protein BKH46_06955 [Helicobacter sp. 12S02634-8]|nr:hypothetical protein BKH46_06955 [Helicobacter sp. 12S02634-8]
MIGITQRLIEAPNYHEIREGLGCEWGEFLGERAFWPLSYAVPFARYAPRLKAVILSGGNDLSSITPNALNQKRDRYEKEIISHCLKTQIPLLGVCRGAQCIAEFFGATITESKGHSPNPHQLLWLADQNTYEVNSYHHYAITALKEPLKPLGLAQDESIEAYRHTSLPIFGMMWHIEREKHHPYPSKAIWENFIQEIHTKEIQAKGIQ